MSYSNVPPPSSLSGRSNRRDYDREQDDEEAVKNYDTMMKKGRSISSRRLDKDQGSDEEYFDEPETQSKTSKAQEEDDEEDELDAFMAGIEKQAKKDVEDSRTREEQAIRTGDVGKSTQAARDDIDQEDMQESYFKFLEDYKERHADEFDDKYEYDEDGNIIWTWKTVVDPLPPVDHSQISYEPFKIGFYKEHEQLAGLKPIDAFNVRFQYDMRVFGTDPPKPSVCFAHFGLDEKLMNRITEAGFEKVTAIQAQAVPSAQMGRDVLGIAKTGSGKTLAYVLPAIVHVTGQDLKASKGKGPIVLVIVPTRELALQVYESFKFFTKGLNLNVVCAHGGGNRYEQEKGLKAGCHICIATPGRIIDLVKMNATDFNRTSFLIFDEADRMFDLGFEDQVRSISDHVRPDRQCLMFSATFPQKIEKLASYALSNPIKILCGDVGEANTDVIQEVFILPSLEAKFEWLYCRMVRLCAEGKVLVFVTKKHDSEIVADKLKLHGIDLVLLHGDMHQFERNERLKAFKTSVPVLVATDVAARGLDIAEIRNVINFDVARDITTHVHRIGRTGRAGQQGHAFTLLTEHDREFAGPLMHNLQNVGQEVPSQLLELAKTSKWYQENGSQDQTVNTRVRTGLGFSSGTTKQPHEDVAARLERPSHSKHQDTISQQVEKAKAVAQSSTGIGMSRYDTMRQVLKTSYRGTFQKAAEDTTPSIPFTDPTPSRQQPSNDQPKKKSRWG